MRNLALSLAGVFVLAAAVCFAAADKKKGDVKLAVKQIAWKAYGEVTGLAVLAEEGPKIVAEFTLDRDVDALGKKNDKIHEVRFAILGGPKTRGLILVNQKTKQSLVVFPKKKTAKQKKSPAKAK